MRVRYEVLVAPRDLIARCLFRCELLFQIRDYLFRVHRVTMNFSRSRFRNCFFPKLHNTGFITADIRSSHRGCSIKKAGLENFAICTRKHLSRSFFLIKLQACNFIKKRLQHRCFPVNIAEFTRTPTLKNIYVLSEFFLQWSLLMAVKFSSVTSFEVLFLC